MLELEQMVTLYNLSTGNYNTVVGRSAGQSITTGYSNVAIGYQAADALTDGGNNIAIGQSALVQLIVVNLKILLLV